MIRILFSLLFILFGNPVSGQFWQTDYTIAKEMAVSEDKPIVLVFQGSDWCAPCIKLDREVWSQQEFQQYAGSHWVMLQADFPRRSQNSLPSEQAKANAALAERYNKNGIFPFVVVMDKAGRVLGETSYQKIGPSGYIKLIESFTKTP
jgi:thioredoxin-related protein